MTYTPRPTPAFSTGATTVRPRGERTPRAVGISQQVERLLDVDLPEWYEDARCAQTGPAAFFPNKGQSPREAKKVCRACPVREQCLAYALENGERWGVWGGTTDEERRKLRDKGEGKPRIARLRHTTVADLEALKASVVADYKAGEPVSQIAARHRVSNKSVATWAREAGVPLRGRGGTRFKGKAAVTPSSTESEAS